MASRDPNRPNVLFVLTDDQGSWALGCAGNDEIHTPSLDGLAASGVRASTFFCVSPVCSPARASLLTGKVPSRHGVHDWLDGGHSGAEGVDFLAGQTLITDLFADAGYRCGLVGKWHLGANDTPRPGFVHWYAHDTGGGPYYGAPMWRDGTLENVDRYLTDVLTEDAVGFLTSEADRPEPFFLMVNYTAPHSPWKDSHPRELTQMYADCAFASCPQEPRHPWQPYVDGRPVGGEHDTRAALIGYFAAVSGVDGGVGAILDALAARGLRESTLVIFSSDNGFNCGHHGIWGKGNGTYPQNMYDTSTTVPALFSQPGRIPGGRTVGMLLSGYDLFPTLLDYAGIPHDPGIGRPGQSFADALTGEATHESAEHVVVFDEYGPVRMIRTEEWKYVQRNPDGPDELYDMVEDPGERRNLIDQPGLDHRVRSLKTALTDWFSEYADAPIAEAALSVTGRGQRKPHDQPGAFR